MKDTMLIFDLDGTLWDSGDNVAASWNHVISKWRPDFHELTGDDIRALMGRTMDDIAVTLFPEMDPAERTAMFDECQDYELEYITEHGGILFPDVFETLSQLNDRGYDLAIVSNCQIGYINAFLTSMNAGKYFCDTEEWGRTQLTKAENIRLVMKRNNCSKAVYIGDTVKDMEASEGADIPFVHAAYGFGIIKKTVQKIDSFPELLELFK